LADELAVGLKNRPLVLALDLTRVDTPARIIHELGARGMEPAFIVNNAGFGLVGRAAELDRAEQLAMIDLNVRTLTDLSLRFVDSLARHRGGILNVASLSAFLPGPGMALYHATKSYVVTFSEALHAELKPEGIRVTCLCPGPVPTEFHGRAGFGENVLPRLLTHSAEWVAERAYAGLMRNKRLVVPGLGNKIVRLTLGAMPQRVVLHMADAAVQRRRKLPPWSRRS
jgi:short-subunit dehydrogenase